MNYTFLKYKDKYMLKNNSATETLFLEVYYKTCDTTTLYIKKEILPTKEIEVVFNADGIFSIKLNNGLIEEVLPDILYYQNTLRSFITRIQKIFCGCKPCSECENCNEQNECEEFESSLKALTQALAYTSLNSPAYQIYVDTINEESKCLLQNYILCSLLKEKFNGDDSYKEAIYYFLANYYGAFYFRERFLAADEEEVQYIDAKYKYFVISKCMKKLGLNPADVVSIIENNTKVYYWQLEDVQEDINNVIPLISIPFLNTLPQVPFSDFEVGKIVTYVKVGRICFAISPTQIQNFTITDSLNNDVTDAFDLDYNIDLNLILFVSKSVYSYSSIYFKFKKLGLMNMPDNGIFNGIFS